MYSTCLFCHASLGANEVIEQFPVGRRLAFDGAKGRLWVVCTRCHRWNLTPIEERWEAIEGCERRFRATKTRVSTPEIGLARTSEGLELVRIGAPLLPEFAAWRYGRIFARRFATTMAWLAGGTVAAGAVAVRTFGATSGVLTFGLGAMALQTGFGLTQFYQRKIERTRVRVADGSVLSLASRHIERVELRASDTPLGWSIRLWHARGTAQLENTEAVRAAGSVLARLNRRGAADSLIRDAIDRLGASPETYVRNMVRALALASATSGLHDLYALRWIPVESRLALEMAMHEDAERQYLAGELQTLQAEWRSADEIAAIADNLLIS